MEHFPWVFTAATRRICRLSHPDECRQSTLSHQHEINHTWPRSSPRSSPGTTSREDDELNTRQTPAQRKAARRLSLLRSPRERSDKCRPQQQVSRTVLSTEFLSLLSTLLADTYRRSARTSTL